MTRPGTRLRSLAARVFDPSTLERLIDPVIADLQCEHGETVRRGEVWRSWWIRLTGYIAFSKVAAIALSRGSLPAVRRSAAADDRALGRTMLFSTLATIAWTLVFIGPALRTAWDVSALGPWLVWYLIPQALQVALPMGIVFGILAGVRRRVVTPRVRRAVILLTIGCSMAMVAQAGWILPAANQASRELMFRILHPGLGPLARGTNELRLGELWRLAQDRVVIPLIANRRAFDFHFRLALGFAPLALGLFALGVASARRRASGVVGIAAIALVSCFAYHALMTFAQFEIYLGPFEIGEHVPAIVAAWGPNLVFLAAALLLWMIQRRAPSAADPSHLDDGRRSERRPVVPQT